MAESRWSARKADRSAGGLKFPAVRSGEKGFTLLEVMVALAIFVASIGVLLAAQTAAARHQERARNLFTATALMRELVTEAETVGLPEAGEDETKGDFGDKFPGFRWKRKIQDAYADASLLSQAAQYGIDLENVKAALPGIRQVTATVTWGEGEREESTSVTWYAVTSWQAQINSPGFSIPGEVK